MSQTVPTSPYRLSWFDWFCIWYPPGWLILFNRHWQHYKSDPEGWNWLEMGLFLLPGGFYVGLALRWLRLGCKAPAVRHVEPDPDYQKAFQQEVLTPIVEHYFRGELFQSKNLPSEGPLIVALNHAGMCFPWDFVSLALLFTQQGWGAQPLAHPIFFDHPWLVWWLPSGWAQVLGGVRADLRSFEAALKSVSTSDSCPQKTVLLYAPEGWRGLAKGWSKRYELATFDPSFIRLSLRYQVPILPIVCMGSEYLHPFTLNVHRLARWLRLPMFPISPLIPAFLLFPSLGVWAVRSHLCYYIQPLWYSWKQESPKILDSYEFDAPKIGSHSKRAALYQMAEKLRSQLQTTILRLRQSINR